MIEIEVCERLMDAWYEVVEDGSLRRRPQYHAQAKGERGIWATGCYPDEAIGRLIYDNPEKFGITITDLGRMAR